MSRKKAVALFLLTAGVAVYIVSYLKLPDRKYVVTSQDWTLAARQIMADEQMKTMEHTQNHQPLLPPKGNINSRPSQNGNIKRLGKKVHTHTTLEMASKERKEVKLPQHKLTKSKQRTDKQLPPNGNLTILSHKNETHKTNKTLTTKQLMRKTPSIIMLQGWTNYRDPSDLPNQVSCADQKYVCNVKATGARFPDSSSHVAMFHALGLLENPPRKPNGQLWIFRTGESQRSLTANHMENWNGLFNYTFDFGQNATAHFYAHNYIKLAHVQARNFSAEKLQSLGKKFLEPRVLWPVSNCDSSGPFKVQSARAEYAYDLSQLVNLVVYSKPYSNCRKNRILQSLITNKAGGKERPILEFTFYLSFENSLCKDYITEKLWNILLGNNLIIPVVMGGLSTKDYESIAPPNSFIDVRNFTSPKDLAQHLRFVAGNSDAFNYYQQWRNEYTILTNYDISPRHHLCQACKLAWERPQSVFEKMGKRFNRSQCVDLSEPRDHCSYYNLTCNSLNSAVVIGNSKQKQETNSWMNSTGLNS